MPPCAISSKLWKPKLDFRVQLAKEIAGFGGVGSGHALTPEFTEDGKRLLGMIPEPNSAAKCHRLFVYGTLRRGFELHHYLPRLGARFLAEAKVAAELIDLGRYPGARPAGRRGKWVRGELFQLRQPARDLRILDELEGFVPGTPEQSEFVRATTEVILDNGARENAWIYWLGANNSATRRIVSGDYAAWVAARTSTGVSHG